MHAHPIEEESITRSVWEGFEGTSDVFPVVLQNDRGEIGGFAALRALGAGEWWLDAPRCLPVHKDAILSLLNHILQIFKTHGDGILRTSAFGPPPDYEAALINAGFKRILSYSRIDSPSRPATFQNFKKLGPAHHELISRYLRNAPMFRLNSFVERRNEFYFLNPERLKEYLTAEDVLVMGWRQLDQLHGLAICFIETVPSETFDLGYFDAPDDTTAAAMLASMRGLAARNGSRRFVWKMPTGLGMERALTEIRYETIWTQQLALYERGVQV
jgi:hypothetical protein